MRFKTIVYLIIFAAVVYGTIDYIRLTASFRMFGWKMFTTTAEDFLAKSPSWGTEANKDMPASGAGVFPESPYLFTEGWHLFHMDNWARLLQDLQNRPDVHGLEVGSYEGMSAMWAIEKILTHPTATITCIDIFDDERIEATFDRNVIATGTPEKIIKVKGPSEHMLCSFKPNTYDFIYIDGCHLPKWVLSDAVMAWELLKPGGLMIFDDYRHIDPKPAGSRYTGINFIDTYLWNKRGQHRDSPKPAIDAFMEIYEPYFEVVYKGFQVALRKK